VIYSAGDSVAPESILPQDTSDELALLTSKQQEAVATILAEYLEQVENGKPVNRNKILSDNPDLADVLSKFMDSVNTLAGAGAAVADSADRTEIEPTPQGSLDESTRLGDYIIKHEIGRGGMGVVYAADQISLGREVALKTLPFAALINERQIARFKNEAQAAASLHHPNIVPVYGVGCDRGIHFFSMQLIEGQSLAEAIGQLREESALQEIGTPEIGTARPDVETGSTKQQFSTRRSIRSSDFVRSVARLGQQAADALHFAHENGVVHRDIKPSNLLLDKSSKLWVTDFGLARISDNSSLTMTGDVIGTARYMSPEQASGRMHEVDYRSDIYALGVTLYELLTLKPVVNADTRQEAISAVQFESPDAPRMHNPSIPADLETIILKATEKHRDDRYSSAGQFADDLGNFLAGRPTIAKRPAWHDTAFRWAFRHRKLVSAGLAASFLVFAFVGIAASMIAVEKQRTQDSKELATKYLRETQHVVDNFGAMVDSRLEHLPGSSSLRVELLGELEKYYSGFVAQTEDDPSFALDLAKTQFRLAAVHQRLGNFQDAAKRYQEARDGFELLYDQQPNDLDRLADIALCYNNLGQVTNKIGDNDSATRHYGHSVTVYQQLDQHKYPDSKAGLARTKMNLGLLLSSQQNPLAAPTLREAHNILIDLVRQDEIDFDSLSQLALCENNLASVVMTEDLVLAETLLRASADRYQQLVESDPASPEYRGNQALALANLASVVVRTGQHEEALTQFKLAIAARQSLLQLEPAVWLHKFDLAIAHQQFAQLYVTSEQWDEAKNAYADSEELLIELLKTNPRDHSTLNALARALGNLATICKHKRNLPAALEFAKRAEDLQRQAVELSPSNFRYAELLNRLRQQVGVLEDDQLQFASDSTNRSRGEK